MVLDMVSVFVVIFVLTAAFCAFWFFYNTILKDFVSTGKIWASYKDHRTQIMTCHNPKHTNQQKKSQEKNQKQRQQPSFFGKTKQLNPSWALFFAAKQCFSIGCHKQTFKRVFVVVLGFTAVVFCLFWLRNKWTICFFFAFFFMRNPY